MFKVGTVFRYKISKSVNNGPLEFLYEKSYRIAEVNDELVKVQVFAEGEESRILETDVSCGSYIFPTKGLSVCSKSPVQIEFEDSVVYADILVSDDSGCEKSESLFLGRDGVAYRYIMTQTLPGGNVLTTIQQLLSVEVQGRIYDNINWVEEEPRYEEDPALSEIEEFKRSVL